MKRNHTVTEIRQASEKRGQDWIQLNQNLLVDELHTAIHDTDIQMQIFQSIPVDQSLTHDTAEEQEYECLMDIPIYTINYALASIFEELVKASIDRGFKLGKSSGEPEGKELGWYMPLPKRDSP